jgi:hypothetical protein
MFNLLSNGIKKDDPRGLRKICEDYNKDFKCFSKILSERQHFDDLELLYLLLKASETGTKQERYLNLKRSQSMRASFINSLKAKNIEVEGVKYNSLKDVPCKSVLSKIAHLMNLTGELYETPAIVVKEPQTDEKPPEPDNG